LKNYLINNTISFKLEESLNYLLSSIENDPREDKLKYLEKLCSLIMEIFDACENNVSNIKMYRLYKTLRQISDK
jgi:hypothetical protein